MTYIEKIGKKENQLFLAIKHDLFGWLATTRAVDLSVLRFGSGDKQLDVIISIHILSVLEQLQNLKCA